MSSKTMLFLLFISFSLNIFAQETHKDIRQAAIHFMDSLTIFQKKRAMLDFSDTARIKWNNLPVGLRARAGVNIGSMSITQRKLVHRMLSATLSSQGYLKATSIMHLDNLLDRLTDTIYDQKMITADTYRMMKDLQWSHKNYYIALFGNPATDKDWGYKLEGHHLSINITFHNDQLSVTPMFVGTDPAEFPQMEYAGWRVLSKEEDYGIELINALTPDQRKRATMSTEVPSDIITGAESGKRLIDYWGIKAAEMNAHEQNMVKAIIREFVFNLGYEKANTEYDKILKAGIQNIYLGWIGSYNEKELHYYVLNGPTFLIEFDNCGPGRGGNHIHAIWRDKGEEYGGDILKEHYQSEHKKQ